MIVIAVLGLMAGAFQVFSYTCIDKPKKGEKWTSRVAYFLVLFNGCIGMLTAAGLLFFLLF